MTPAEQLRYLVLAAQREGNRMLAAALRPLGLTPSQAEVLRVLGDREPLSLGELGELLICESGTNPSRLVDRLVGMGLVHRTSAEDRRRLVLSLTADGHAREARVRTIEDALYARIDAAGDPTAAIEYLERAVSGTPAGAAFALRS